VCVGGVGERDVEHEPLCKNELSLLSLVFMVNMHVCDRTDIFLTILTSQAFKIILLFSILLD